MEFTSVQNTSKIWAPTASELQELSINKYNKNSNRLSLFSPYFKVGQENSIQTLIFRLTKKYIRIDKRNSFELMEEDALQLDAMYKRERFFQPSSEVACAICNVEKIERNLVFEMQKEIEMTKLVRNIFMMMDNSRYYSLCLRHRSCYAHFNMKCALGCLGSKYTPPRINYEDAPRNYDVPIQKPVEEAVKNEFFIPCGENPAEYMALNFNWDDYMKQFKTRETRMPYTNSIKLVDN